MLVLYHWNSDPFKGLTVSSIARFIDLTHWLTWILLTDQCSVINCFKQLKYWRGPNPPSDLPSGTLVGLKTTAIPRDLYIHWVAARRWRSAVNCFIGGRSTKASGNSALVHQINGKHVEMWFSPLIRDVNCFRPSGFADGCLHWLQEKEISWRCYVLLWMVHLYAEVSEQFFKPILKSAS